MGKEDIRKVLKDRNLRVTRSRMDVLGTLFSAGDTAISSQEIEHNLDSIDRITLYRMLKTFEEVGIVHSIADGTGKTKYAVCCDGCSDGHHVDDHVHFHCRKCDTTSCLEGVIAPKVRLPQGYLADDTQFVVSGICKDCS